MPDAAPTAPRPHAIPLTGWLLTAAAAIIAQVLFVASTADELPFQIPTVDSATYHAQALAIAQNRPAPRVPFWQPPLYPYTLAALYALGITSMTAVRLVHGLSALCTALLVLCVARRVTTPRIATAAAITTSLYGPMLFFTTQLLPTGLAVATGMAALLAYLRLREAPTRRRAGICGATYALAALAVPNILACLILPVLHLARRRAWRLLAVCLAGAALLILPVTLRNRVIGGDWVLISTNAGINLYIGNNEQTTLTLTARPGQDWDRLTQMPYTHGATSPAESQRWFLREFFHYATTSPLHFCCGLANKTWLLLGAAELPRNLDLYVFRPFSWMHALLTWRLPWFAFPFGLVGPLALLGILTSFRANRPARTITAHATIYALTLILFYPAARYRLPLIPPLLILAAVGTAALLQHLPAASRFRIPAASLAPARRPITLILLLVFLVLCNYPRSAPTSTINFAAELQKNLGVGLQVRNKTADAMRAYDAALAHDPHYADAHYFRATLLRANQNPAEARAALQAALAARPNHIKALKELGVVEFNAGRVELAESLLRRALAADPRNAQTMRNLALALVRLGKQAEAEELLKRAKLAERAMPEAGP